MKKLNTTYLDNLVSKILKETLEERADSLVSKIKGDMCEQCGGNMNEDVCEECGNSRGEMEEGIYNVEDIDNSNEFDSDEEELDSNNSEACKYHMDNFGPEDERTHKFCGSNMNESLKGRQRRLDKNKNNKIDAEDFKMLRQGKKSETDEGNAFTGALSKARKSGDDNFEVGGKKFETKEGKKTDNSFKRYCGGEITKPCIDRASKSGSPSLVKKANLAEPKKKIKESYQLTESEMVSMIEKIVLERKNKEVKDSAEKNNIKGMGGSPRGLEVYKKAHNGSGKENDEYIKLVTKKMKEYLKDGSKGDYDMNPKIFPKGNGELEKMKKTAYEVSEDGEEFIDDYLRPGMETLDYDEMHPNEEWMDNNIEGSSKTGNNPEWANTGESDVNKKINKTRKKGAYNKVKRAAYNKSPQPVISDKPGQESGKGIHIKIESFDKKQKQINEEFDRIKSLMGYNQKTQ